MLFLPIPLNISHLGQQTLSQFYIDLAKNSKLDFCGSHKDYQKPGGLPLTKIYDSKVQKARGAKIKVLVGPCSL